MCLQGGGCAILGGKKGKKERKKLCYIQNLPMMKLLFVNYGVPEKLA